MSALVYILYRSLKNTVKGLIRKPAALIAYIIIACLFLSTFILTGLSQEEPSAKMNMDVAKSIFIGYTVFLFVIAFATCLGGVSFFRMADINMLFTAPLKAGYILIYGFVKQLAANFMIMLYLALQYPNWKRMFGFIHGAGWILMISYMLLLTLTSLLGMVLYAYVSKKPQRRPTVKKLIFGSVIIFVMPIIINTYKTGDFLNSTVMWLSNDYLKFIPLIGWFREMLMGAYTGVSAELLLYIFLTLMTILVTFIYLYRMDTEFYEYVVSGTEIKETMVKSIREGKSGTSNVNRKYRKVKAKFTLEGSLAIFQRQMLEKRKSGFWLISTRTIVLLIGALLAAVSIPVDGLQLISGMLAVSAYIMFIFTMAATWEGDLSLHYIYLIPATPMKKMLSATLPEVIKILIEGVLIFGIVGVILRVSFWVILAAILAYSTLGAVFVYSDLVVRRMFGKIHGNILRIFFLIFLLIVIISFVVTPAVMIFVSTNNYALAFFTIAIINTVLVVLFMCIGTGLFKSPELT
jgi:hypothetical protein